MGLELAYTRARDIIGPEGAECLAAAIAVEQLRKIWKPEPVQVILLAESHVWTSGDELHNRVTNPNGEKTGFVRFVYCLGYGEPDLVPGVTSNSGTPQFWKLFHDTLYEPTAPHTQVMKSGEPDWQKRTRNKLDLLEQMQRAGIWLVDASVTAIVRNGTKLVAGSKFDAVLRVCWDAFIRDVVCGCAPSAILIVGKGVESAIGEKVRQLGSGVDVVTVNQPNARLPAEAIARDRRACFDLCSRYRARKSGRRPPR
jgi:hypothetical protein